MEVTMTKKNLWAKKAKVETNKSNATDDVDNDHNNINYEHNNSSNTEDDANQNDIILDSILNHIATMGK